MDFYQIAIREIERGPKKGEFEIYPDFTVGRSKDLMVKGRSFYAVWDEEVGLWSTDEYDVQRLVDADLHAYADKMQRDTGVRPQVRYLRNANNGGWYAFRKFMQNISDNSKDLDSHITFANTEVKKSDYASRRLPYPLEEGPCEAWNELVGTLYSVEERAKIEWFLGAIVSGDSKKIQKFGVFYGPPASGKSTMLNIFEDMFGGYVTTFDAKALGSSGAAFATEVFKTNPLLALQHDGDLSKIEDNARLNSIISHETMPMNEKYKPGYSSRVNAILLMGTNQPVKISDAKSGIIRRLIDIHPTGVKIPTNHYHTLMSQISFEFGAIAYHCLQTYLSMGKNFYNAYRPLEMMLQTDVFFNFIEAYYDIFRHQDSTTLKQAYGLYKEFCSETGIDRVLPQYKVREELRNYFDKFQDRAQVDGVHVRSYYSGFNANKFKTPTKGETTYSLVIEETESILDQEFADQPAQYEVWDEELEIFRPEWKWKNVKTSLKDIDTSRIHYVKVPENHIVIDFDLTDPKTGEKSLERNLEAASVWPATYAELSKGGAGVHLHYNYDGDVEELSSIYSEGIEVKTLLGDAGLRRRLSKCNNVPVATINSGLPIKEKKLHTDSTLRSERGLRDLIGRNLRKEIHPGTKPSIDFIAKILDDAYSSGMEYDITDMRGQILAFANNSTHQALYCLKVVQGMKFASADPGHSTAVEASKDPEFDDSRVAYFDVEVYPNLFVVCWKYEGDSPFVTMINPTPAEMEQFFKLKLVGFFNRQYDNHICYARYLGYTNEQLFRLSQKLIVENDKNAKFGEAFNISYADIYDYASIKKSLKKWEIDLGLNHMEMDIPWDKPVKDEDIPRIVDYCCNDVAATEATAEDRKQDFAARQILADLSGLSVNDTTQRHTAKIIFGNDRRPQQSFVYTDLSKEFPGYTFDPSRNPKSDYRGEDPSEGGYVYAEPGMYYDVAVLDVASMHPTSIIQLNLFGEYTPRFADLYEARLAIKHGDLDSARKMLGGALKPYLNDPQEAKQLAYALKIVINIVYGLTSAKFDNMFRDIRNRDNIVAKRGALFMIDLKHFVQERGFTVAHIKTDSIKIPGATPEIIEEVMRFGEKYGYSFEHETTYKKFCLVNDAVYIANDDHGWEAVGAQFQHPYVFKTLFSHEPITFDDVCETKQVTSGVMYLDFNIDMDAVGVLNTEPTTVDDMVHVGRAGRFVPVPDGAGGGILYRVKDDKRFIVTGTKGFNWVEAEHVKGLGEEFQIDKDVDLSYFEKLIKAAKAAINQYGNFEEFVS